MILTGSKLQEFGYALYGQVWIAVLSRKLRRSKRTIMRWRDSPGGLPIDLQRHLLEMMDEQMRVLADKRSQIAATFDDVA